ncbi:MAG: TonB C-terminal domain-containing protein [Elusimicrobia bacterium]|nr:TonB C-terminal domain-containing protein [Elusimicrobiota bacterium]
MLDIKFSFVVSLSLHFLFFLFIHIFIKTAPVKMYYIPVQVINPVGYGAAGIGGGSAKPDTGGSTSVTGAGESFDVPPDDLLAEDYDQQLEGDDIKLGDIIAAESGLANEKTSKKKADESAGKEIWKKSTGTGGGGAGSSGGGAYGNVGFDISDFPYMGYVNVLRNKVAQNWNPTPYTSVGTKKVLVYFKILKNGEVKNLEIEESSGISYIDRSAKRAIMNASPFPPLPAGFPDKTLGVHFAFELSGI